MKRINRKIKKINNKRITIIVVINLLLSIFLLQKRNNISFLEKITRDIFLTPLGFISNVYTSDKYVSNENDTINMLRIENVELKKEIVELKNIVNINDMLSDKVVVSANIINRNIGYFFDTVTINKGATSGLKEGMAVVASTGLIGKTIQVSEYYSDVLLLTSSRIGKVSVKICNNDNTIVYGLLTSYNSEDNVYFIEGISKTTSVDIGANVTTTGMGEIFPSGILIGTVTNITTDHFDLSMQLEVTPIVNVNDFTVVSVLKRNVNN